MDAPTLVDSNVFINMLRRGMDPAAVLTRTVSSTDLATCGMVRLEVLRGVKTARVRDRLAGFFDVMQNVPADNRIWESATEIAWTLARSGITIPAQDALISACAMRIGASVLTADGHFDHVRGIRVTSWIG